MKNLTLSALLFLALGVSAQDKDPKQLVARMVETVGGVDAFYAKKDVQYTYLYERGGQADVSQERYVFDGELSWARYEKMQTAGVPAGEIIVQGFDGQNAWATRNGEAITDQQTLRMADFLRKTNYYWFAMMFKLVDPGINYQYEGTRRHQGVAYDLVRITFGDNVGDVQDTYVLYINPYTHLVDQFLFTVLDFDVKDPLMMRVQYKDVDGLLLPVVRSYTRSNWEGEVKQDADWIIEISTDVTFNNGFKKELFTKPN